MEPASAAPNSLVAKIRAALGLAAPAVPPAMPALPASFAADNERVREMLAPGYVACTAPNTPANCVAADDPARSMLRSHLLPGAWLKAPFNVANELGWTERDFYFECNVIAREVSLHWYEGTVSKGFGAIIPIPPAGITAPRGGGPPENVAANPCTGMRWRTASVGFFRTNTEDLSACVVLRQEHGSKTSPANFGNGVLAIMTKDDRGAFRTSAEAAAAFNGLFRTFHAECMARSGPELL